MSTDTNTTIIGAIDPKSIPSVSPGTGTQDQQAVTGTDTETVGEVTTLSLSGLVRFAAYDPKTPTLPVLGGRVVPLCYKGKTVDKVFVPAKLANSCIEIPLLDKVQIAANMESLMPHVVAYLETVQDSIAKELHAAKVGEVQESSFSIGAILTKLEATTSSNRMSKEDAEQWFDTTVADNLAVLFADKFGMSDDPTEDEIDKLNSICAVYKKNLSALAGPKTSYKVEEAEMLKKVLELTDAKDSAIGTRMFNRLDKMITDAAITPAMIGLI